MNNLSATQRTRLLAAALGFASIVACGDDDDIAAASVGPAGSGTPTVDAGTGAATGSDSGSTGVAPTGSVLDTGVHKYVLASIVLDPSDTSSRTTYLQAVSGLDQSAPFSNKAGIEIKGNAALIGGDGAVFVAYAEEPTWERFELDDKGQLKSIGKMSLQQLGADSPGYSHAFVDAETAVTVLTNQFIAVVWNPKTMTITGEVDLSHLKRDGYDLEAWTTVAYQGRVYIPARWQNWEAKTQIPGTSVTIIDPKALKVLGVAEDDRCTSGGAPAFDDKGYAYVMADGRTYSDKTFALFNNQPVPKDHCILRIAPGQLDFEQSYYYAIPPLTGGLDSIVEMIQAAPGSPVGFAKVFDPSKLAAGEKADSYDFWSKPYHQMWSFTLTDPPVAKAVGGLGFSSVGFTPIALGGKVYSGESTNNDAATDVFEIDPATNSARLRFKVEGQFLGLFDLVK